MSCDSILRQCINIGECFLIGMSQQVLTECEEEDYMP